MQHEAEVEIIERVLAHLRNRTTDAAARGHRQPALTYHCPDHHRRELERVLRRRPAPVCHASVVAAPGAYATFDVHGVPVIVARTIAPIDAGRARIRVTVLVDPEQEQGRPEKVAEDVALLKAGLAEDYAVGESIQAGFAAGANEHLHFGLFEGTLAHFHQALAAALGDACGG
jgi:hypothetical protein